MRILRAADRVAVPWKNGGGSTREVAVWPPGAGLDDFEWRVSIAEVHAPGPFSLFPGIDRTLTVLEGRLELTFADRTIELAPESDPFSFPGDVPCDGRPIGGPVMDLNVLTRRGVCSARVQRIASGTVDAARQTIIVATQPATLRFGAEAASLQRFDAALIENAASVLDGAAFVIVIE
jgi:hypothetical protein